MLTLALAASLAAPAPAPLTPAQVAAGWKPLDQASWRSYKAADFPSKGWTVTDGVLTHAAAGSGGDIVTRGQYGDFEFACQFRTAAKANSGIIYRVAETGDAPWMTGPEFQVLDDSGAGEKPDSTHATAALYDIFAPAGAKSLKPAGEWNDARIRLSRGVLQHHLNGAKVLDVRLFDDETDAPVKAWTDKIAASKFKGYKGFGVQPKGHIALQDHGDEVSYRGLMVRDLRAPMPGEQRLFNGKDLAGWTTYLSTPDGKKINAVGNWTVDEGVLVCKGASNGYIRTIEQYTSYVLRLQWRFSPETKKAGNSGVLLRVTGPDKLWPRCVEAQLMSGRAGDIISLGLEGVTGPADRTKGRVISHARAAEREIGEWNDYEIIVYRGAMSLCVNGELVNSADGAEQIAGFIALQSEGAEIHFRDIRLAPIP